MERSLNGLLNECKRIYYSKKKIEYIYPIIINSVIVQNGQW